MKHGDSISGDYYKDNCLEPLFDNIKQRRSKSGLHVIKLHHDNAKPHQTKDIKIFLQQQGVMLMPHPPYSPDLAPSDFWLFGYLKQQLDTYSDSESFKKAVTKIIHDISRDEFRKTFNKWIERMQLCISNKGEYFEHLMK
jgi:transposase